MDRSEIERLRKLLAGVRPPEWRAYHHSLYACGPEGNERTLISADNAYSDDDFSDLTEDEVQFIALARNLMPALLDHIDALEARIAQEKI